VQLRLDTGAGEPAATRGASMSALLHGNALRTSRALPSAPRSMWMS
jgi:hypothetical protein